MNKDQANVLVEIKKTLTKASYNGADLEGFHYGFRRQPKESSANIKPPATEPATQEEPANIKWEPDKVYIKLYPGHIFKLTEDLTSAEMRIVFLIPEYLSYQSGQLKNANGNPLTMADIEKLTGFTNKTVIKSAQKLIAKKILFRGRTGNTEHDPYQFYANPHIFFMGKYINPTLIDMFKDYKKPK